MNNYDYNTKKEKFKHLTYNDLRIIEREYNNYIKSSNNTISKTDFMKKLAFSLNTCLSNLYNIIKSGMVELLNYDLTIRKEFSADLAYKTRETVVPNNTKIVKAKNFIDLVVNRFKRKHNIESIETIINDLIINHKEKIKGMPVVCVKTIYNYINDNKLEIKRIDLPIAVKRKKRVEKREYLKTKGTSIDERPEYINNRLEFGHWEGDTVIGTKSKGETLLTLVERKTRETIIVKMKNRKSKTVLMAINKIEKQYGKEKFKKIFKSITFDNGNEFARFKDIEKKYDSKDYRTKVYFAHPYCSWERGTNERHNRIIRKFIPKGNPIENYSNEYIEFIQNVINNSSKKVLGYKSSEILFNQELAKI